MSLTGFEFRHRDGKLIAECENADSVFSDDTAQARCGVLDKMMYKNK